MALLNNCLFNAAYTGFIAGSLQGRSGQSATATSYLKLTQAAQAFATQVDSGILFDALITTNANNTQLAITTNTIAANEMSRINLLKDICAALVQGRYSEDAVQADWTALAAQAVAVYTEALLLLVTP